MTRSRSSLRELAYPHHLVGLREVGLRDGLQLTRSWPPSKRKEEWIANACRAGVRHFEVGSFLPTDRYPQFADTGNLVVATGRIPGARSAVLAINERGVEDAFNSGANEILLVVSATEEHSQANARRSRKSAIALVEATANRSERPIIHVTISVAFGCSIGGQVAPGEVRRLVDKCLDAGVDIVSIADTVGYAGPRQVIDMCKLLSPLFDDALLGAHFHDTRGTAIANAFAALECGVRILDGTLAGLGGCPFAPGASGNAVFEDLVFLCERSGFPTGIDLDALAEARAIVETDMPGESLHGALARAGPPSTISWRANP